MEETKKDSSLENINDIFKIPICYNDNVNKLNNNIYCNALEWSICKLE